MRLCMQMRATENGIGGEEMGIRPARPPPQMAVMRGRRSSLLLLVMSRTTTAMTMSLVVSEYRFCTQAEQRTGTKGKDS